MQAVEQKPKRKYTRRATVPVKRIPTRKEVLEFISCYGGKAFYSGKNRILFISIPIEDKIISEYGAGLPFSLTTNN